MGPVEKSKAARFNAHTLKLLQAAVKQDPEVDLTTKLPTRYSDRLDSMRNSERPDHRMPPTLSILQEIFLTFGF